jgi:hypothetical protein
MLATLALPALAGLLATATVLTLITDWRLRFVALALQYGLAALVLAQSVIWQVAAVKAVVGTLVVAILMLTGRQVNFARRTPLPGQPEGRLSAFRRIELQTNLLFRIVAVALCAIAAWYLVTETGYAVPGLPLSLNLAGVLLAVLGLLGLGLTEEPISTGIALLTVLTGFDLLYAPLERSLAVVALIAAVHFGAALVVSYLALLRFAGRDAIT